MIPGRGLLGQALLGADDASGSPPSVTRFPLAVTVSAPVGTLYSLSVRVAAATPAAAFPLAVHVFTPGASPARWRPVVTLGGVDVSARITGVISVEAGESEARIASFSVVPSSGTITPADWVGKRVTIDFAEADSSGSAINVQRLFTGVVDIPEYDINSGVAQFACTDQRQEVIANTPRAWIDANVGGYYSAAVAGEPADNLQYAQARLATVPVALDLDAWQRARVTPWASDTPYMSLTEADIVDGSLTFSLPSRADLRNTIEATFEYRFPRLRSRTIISNWYLAGDYRAKSNLPTKAMVDDALTGLPGWLLDGGVGYYEPPIGTQTWNSGIYAMPADVAAQLCIGWTARHRARWVQQVTERYTIRVSNAASVGAIGEARDSIVGATLEAKYDASTWLTNFSAEPLLQRTSAGDEAYDYGAADSDRAASDAAIEAVVASAQTAVRASHRAGRVGFSVPTRADYDLAHTFAINATMADGRRLQAAGKAVTVRHDLDLLGGSATTAVEIAISGHAAVGLQPYDAPSAPTQPADPSAAPAATAWSLKAGTYVGQRVGQAAYDDEGMVGFTTNLVADDATGTYDPFGDAYPIRFRVASPEIEASATNPLDLSATHEYAVDIPQDLFEVTS